MNIKGLTLQEIGNKLEKYLIDYFKGYEITNLGECLFAESYTFEFQEIQHLMPNEYHLLFKPNDKFNGASGIFTVAKQSQDNEYTVFLLSNEDYTKAIIFGIQAADNKIIVLKNFLVQKPKGDISCLQ